MNVGTIPLGETSAPLVLKMCQDPGGGNLSRFTGEKRGGVTGPKARIEGRNLIQTKRGRGSNTGKKKGASIGSKQRRVPGGRRSSE